jgi:hypothetical protein
MAMGRMEDRQDLQELIGLITKLHEEGRQEAAGVLLIDKAEIKVIKCKDG